MPSSQNADQEALLYPNEKRSSAVIILQSVKEQEAQFEQLSRQLEAERLIVANQLERYKHQQESGSDYIPQRSSYLWQPSHETLEQTQSLLDADNMADSHLLINRKTESTVEEQVLRTERLEEVQRRYYPDAGADIRHYIHESLPQESYSVSYHSSSTTNGHHGGDNGDVSPSSSQLSVPGDNATLISRSTAQTKTQQVKTITKVITTREVRHVGPDGLPIDYPMYAGQLPPGGDYGIYPYTGPPSTTGHEYGTYDSGRPPSPGGQVPPHGYPGDYSTYGRTPSPNSGRNYELYPQQGSVRFPEYDYQDYTGQPPSPPSAASESPPPRRAVPQAPRGPPLVPGPHDNQPSGYDELDGALAPPPRTAYSDRFHPSPSPGIPMDMYNPYGYTTGPPAHPATSPNFSPYEVNPPQGYLDRRPSYDEHPQVGGAANPRPPLAPYAPRTAFEEESGPGGPPSMMGPQHGEDQMLPPHRHIDFDPLNGEARDVRWRDPDLHEVIEFLGHPNNVVRANAAAYLQHLCYMDDNMKQKTRALGGIPPLIDLLSQEIPEIQRNACGALRNLSYGRQNDENKRAIRNAGGIPALVRLMRKTPDNEIRELITGVLWNLSSCEDLKRPIIDDALGVLVNHIIIPHSGWEHGQDPNETLKNQEIYWSTVFRNASGVLRNVSSAGEYARRKLRDCESLVEALLHLTKAAIGKNDMDNKSVENCVCVLRNLSYRCQEVEDPEYDKHLMPSTQSRAVAGLKAVGDNLGCFGASKKKKEAAAAAAVAQSQTSVTSTMEKQPKKDSTQNVGSASPRPRSDPARGMELLWQPEVVQPYLALLSECSNPETLEAAAGAIQNLAACYWQPSIDIRAAVRKDKGLPILVELLRMEVDRVVCAVATALRNLAMDHRNKELIGKHAMEDLVKKLPSGDPQHDAGTSDDTVAAVLATLNEVIVKNCDFAHSLLEARGVQRLTFITKNKGKFSPRVVKFSSQLLFNMWQHQELREVYRKAGWKESHFVSRSMMGSRSGSNVSPPSSANNTLSRPISTQGGTKYEDRTLPRADARELNSTANSAPVGQHGGPVFYNQSDELPLSDLSHMGGGEHPLMGPPMVAHRPPVGGVPIFPPGPAFRSSLEPVYAQVNRDKKKNRNPEMSSQSMLLEHEANSPAGDSWV